MKPLVSVRFVVSLVGIFALLAIGCYFFPRSLIGWSLPLLTFPISVFHPHFDVETGMVGSNAVYLQVLTLEDGYVGATKRVFRRPFRLVHDPGSIFGMPLVFFSFLFSWPGLPIRYRLKAALLAFPVLLLLVMLDFSLTLLVEIEVRLVGATIWNNFLGLLGQLFNAGGRQFLGLALFGAVLMPRYLKKPVYSATEPLERNSPCPCGSGKKYKNCCMR